MPAAAATDPARLLDQSIPLERLPQLSLALDRVAALLGERLQAYFATPASVSLVSVQVGQVFNLLSERGESLAGLLRAQAWDGLLLAGLEHSCLDLVIQAMLGGDSAGDAGEARIASAFDMRVLRLASEAMSAALTSAFASAAPTAFVIERMDARVDPLMLGKRDGPGLAAFYELQVLGRSEKLFLLLPQATLGSVKMQLARDAERAAPDPKWLTDLRSRVEAADVVISAIIDQRVMTLGDIDALRIGSLIDLRPDAINRILLSSDGAPLFSGQLGQASGHYTVRIDDVYGENPEEQPEPEYIDEGELT